MATEQTSRVATEEASFPKWASWLATLVGLWLVVSPFVLTGAITEDTAMWSTTVGGLAVLLLGGYAAYSLRTDVGTETGTAGEWAGWVTAIVGIWLAVSPFVLTGPIAEGTALWSTVVGGAIAAILTAFTGYEVHTAGA